MRGLSEEQREICAHYAQSGHPISAYAEDVGITISAAYNRSYKWGINFPRAPYPKSSTYKLICEMAMQGISQATMARRLGCTRANVNNIMIRYNIPDLTKVKN